MCNRSIYTQGYDERVNRAIVETGMSKAEVARKMGCDKKTVHTTRGVMMNSGNLARFCAVTGVSADWILGLRREMR